MTIDPDFVPFFQAYYIELSTSGKETYAYEIDVTRVSSAANCERLVQRANCKAQEWNGRIGSDSAKNEENMFTRYSRFLVTAHEIM